MNVSDLSDVATFDFNGSSFGAQFIQLDHKTYIAFTSQNGSFQFGFDTVMGSNVSYLSICKLKHNTIKQIKMVNLPQINNANGITIKVSDCKKHALIGVGTRRIITGKTIFLTDSNHQQLSDCDGELRIYKFNKHELCLTQTKKTNITTVSPCFYPKDGLMLIDEQMSDGNPSFFNIYDMGCEHPHIVNGTFGAPPLELSVFSGNGKWLLVAGSDQDSSNINNINLYRVDN